MKSNRTKFLLIAGATAAGVSLFYATKRSRYSGIKLRQSIVINKPASDLYAFWRSFENLPKLSDLLESVQVLSPARSRWTVAAPGGIHMQWEAEITRDPERRMIGWRSVEGSTVETAGYVKFEDAPGRRGTVVRIVLECNPPAGKFGAFVSTLSGKTLTAHVDTALRRFKQLMEAGEIAVADRDEAMPEERRAEGYASWDEHGLRAGASRS